jgi:hypothetical protein
MFQEDEIKPIYREREAEDALEGPLDHEGAGGKNL